jgi:hypothetical protein
MDTATTRELLRAKALLGPNGAVVVPWEVRNALGWQEGAPLVSEVQNGAVRVSWDMERDPDQDWFFETEWLAGEQAVDQNIATGRMLHFDSDQAFVDQLEACAPDENR